MWTPPVVEVLLGHVDAKMAVHGGEDVLGAYGSFLGFSAFGIGFAHHATTLDTATSNCGAEDVRVVVAPSGGIHLGRTAELAPCDNHDVIGESAFVEVFEEG